MAAPPLCRGEQHYTTPPRAFLDAVWSLLAKGVTPHGQKLFDALAHDSALKGDKDALNAVRALQAAA